MLKADILIQFSVMTQTTIKVIKLSGGYIKLSVGKQGRGESRKVIKLSSLQRKGS